MRAPNSRALKVLDAPPSAAVGKYRTDVQKTAQWRAKRLDRKQSRSIFGAAPIPFKPPRRSLMHRLANRLSVISLLAVFGGAILAVSISGWGAGARLQQVDKPHFPTTDYGSMPSDLKERERWQSKSKKYKRKHAPKITESTDQIFHIIDWDVRLLALPVARSAAIVTGEITNEKAYLSEDETNIYSEFSIRIDEVLKNDIANSLSTGSSLIAEREGGRVRFPSGKIVTSYVIHQDMPRTGRSYAFFLTHAQLTSGDSEWFHLLTAYELRDDRVFPLDDVSDRHPMNRYKGASETDFLLDLRAAIAKGDSAN